MRVICENCGATYKIPESKLVKEVNKATCRKCGFKMMIRRPSAAVVAGVPPPANADSAATQVTGSPFDDQPGEHGLMEADTRVQAAIIKEWSDEAPTQVQVDPTGPPGPSPAPAPAPAPARPVSSSAPKPQPVIVQSGKAPGDMLLALVATFASAGGAMLLATNIGGSPGQRTIGLGIALWGAFTCLFLLVTGSLWRQRGNVPMSIALATVLGLGGSAFVEVALHGASGLGLDSLPTMPDLSKTEAEPPTQPSEDETQAVDALTVDAEDEAPVDLTDPEEAADPLAEASDAPAPKRSTSSGSTARSAPPPIEDDSEELGDPDLDEVAMASNSQSQAEENRRSEMEAAAQARAAQREREEREVESRRAREEKAARAAAERAKAAKAAAARRAASAKSRSNPSSGSAMKTLPLTVVDTMVRSNMSIKRCFFAEKQASGAMPRRVNVRFTVLNTGRVSSARVTTDQYKGGTLDSCLGRAFKAIQFPPFQGEAKSMTYPFVL